ncbi:hypothetical protein E2C01_051285 [Portunus trituberculatus]|uniref:Uncharacterized protein n=1 Tax=Portunus trituberculatus TaxID=210409 RepID=A0A5B7GJW6_PORTR|nr:hypothetical protein [Portunus trituberculatus]
MAGTKHDLDQAEHLRKAWLQQGLDQVFLQPYNVQLSKPQADKPNKFCTFRQVLLTPKQLIMINKNYINSQIQHGKY